MICLARGIQECGRESLHLSPHTLTVHRKRHSHILSVYPTYLCIKSYNLEGLFATDEIFLIMFIPGLDLLSNGTSLGFFIPLSAWSINQPIESFPQLYFFATICYLLALYCPTMAVDVEFDRKFGIETFATKVGASATMKLSWAFTIFGVIALLYSGFYEIFPWNRKLLIWTGWLLVLEVLIHYVFLPIHSRPSYHTVAKGSIILATFEATATFLFLVIFLDLLPID